MAFFTKSTLVIFFSFFALIASAQYNSLRVQDPRQGFRTASSPIDSAAITIKPKGLYAEVGLYMTYSSKTTSFTSVKDTLEVQHYFNLPKDVMVVDSWLWFRDIIIRAKLIDRWTASTIYNQIVGRRSDPSLLMKNSATDYEFRIFPMAGNETRRIKLTFLIPMRWQGTQPYIDLPANLATVSNVLPKLNVRVFDNSEWKNPRLLEFPNLKFEEQKDSLGASLGVWTDLTTIKSNGKLRIAFDSPVKNGVFASRYSTAVNEGVYQVLLFPNEISDITTNNRKLLVAVDYNASNTNIQPAALLSQVKDNLRNTLGLKDSFNLIFSKLSPTPLSNSWFSATKLDSVFTALGTNPISNISNLPTLLSKSIEHLKKNSGGKLVLFSSDASFMNFTAANELIDELKKIATPLPQINVLDFSNMHHSGMSIGNTWFVGNTYLYSNLARQSGGNNYDIYYANDITDWTLKLFQNTGSNFDNFDLYTTLEDGYCYGRFNIDETNRGINNPVLQIGKYKGKLPFRIEYSGTYNGIDFNKKMTIAEGDIKSSDPTLNTYWAGNNLFKLESSASNQDNNIIAQIVNASMENRVLARFTAFLALEPSQGGDTCFTCDNKNRITSTTAIQDLNQKNLTLSASPNPFKDATFIKITFDAWKGNGKSRLMIYDIAGKLIKVLELNIKEGDTQVEINWDASNVPAGVYLARFVSDNVQKTIKIVKMD